MPVFALHTRLAADTFLLGHMQLSHLLLMNDATYPWLILVPERPDVSEILELAAADRAVLMEEIVLASRALAEVFRPDKINVAALGNLVPQLHVHVVARFHSDAAWPAPVWGRTPPQPYAAGQAEDVCRRIADRLGPEVTPA